MSGSKIALSKAWPASKLEFKDGANFIAIRPVQVSDAATFAEQAAKTQSELKKFMSWAHFPSTYTFEGQANRLKGCVKSHLNGGDFFGLVENEKGEFLLSIGLHLRSMNPDCFEIAFWCGKNSMGKGLTTLATKIILVYCMDFLKSKRVQITHDVKNVASKRVIEKCGFVFEGVLRQFIALAPAGSQGEEASGDVAMYSLLPAEAHALPWFFGVKSKLKVFDFFGNELVHE